MAEIRTHDSEGGSDLGRLVREALGGNHPPRNARIGSWDGFPG